MKGRSILYSLLVLIALFCSVSGITQFNAVYSGGSKVCVNNCNRTNGCKRMCESNCNQRGAHCFKSKCTREGFCDCQCSEGTCKQKCPA